MYIFVILLSALFLSAYEIFKKVSLKKSNIYEILFFYCFFGFLTSLIFIKEAFNIDLMSILLILVKSIIIVADWILVIKALEHLDVGVVSPLSLISTILVVFGSFLIFKENISWTHFLSLLFIGGGVVLISFLEKAESKKKNNWYILILLLASIFATISSLLDKYLLNIIGISNKTILIWFMCFNTLIYLAIYKIKNKTIDWLKVKENYWVILAGVSIVLSDILYFSAITMEGAQLSLITILRKFSVVISTILASIFLKEKNIFKKIGILVIMLIGVIIPVVFK